MLNRSIDSIKPSENYSDYLTGRKSTDRFTDLEFGRYFVLWKLNELEQLNYESQLENYAPGFLDCRSDGEQEFRPAMQMEYFFAILAIRISAKDAVKISNSWAEFVSHIKIDSEQYDKSPRSNSEVIGL